MYLQVLPQFQTPRFKHLLIIGRKATFSFFSPRLWLIFFLLVFYYLWAWWKENYFLFPCLVLFISAYWRSLWVFNTLFADLSYELPPALPFLPCLNAKVNYRRNNIYIILICIYRPCDIIYLLYWIYIIR